jgi:hypothetical protein
MKTSKERRKGKLSVFVITAALTPTDGMEISDKLPGLSGVCVAGHLLVFSHAGRQKITVAVPPYFLHQARSLITKTTAADPVSSPTRSAPNSIYNDKNLLTDKVRKKDN